MSTVIEILTGLEPVAPYTSQRAPKEPIVACPSLLYGLELEIEGCHDGSGQMVVAGMRATEDGSLRNDGAEFITRPMLFHVLAHVLNMFFIKNNLTMENNYSERCSVHVHVNVQDLSVEQLATVCLLYQVFEKLLFGYAGEHRSRNVFCVPWSETNITFHSINSLVMNKDLGGLRSWQKYTALNLLPLFTQGSIEFRHLEGTNNPTKILNWCQIIGCLFEWARNNSMLDTQMELMNLNTNSQYEAVLNKVFGSFSELLRTADYRESLEEGVLNMKYSLCNDINGTKARSVDPFGESIARLQELMQATTGPTQYSYAEAPTPAAGWIVFDDETQDFQDNEEPV